MPKGVKATRDGGLIVHPGALDSVDAEEGSSIRVPQASTELGAGFGDTITDADRRFASEREPVAYFLTIGMAADIFDKWFIIDDPTSEGGDPQIDEAVQNALTGLEAKQKLTEAVEYERIYGWSLLIGSFTDVSDVRELMNPLVPGSKLLQLSPYPKTKVQVWTSDADPNSSRYMQPKIYKVYRGEGSYLYVHHSRCCRIQTRSSGKSVLDPIWDDLCCGRNIRWGAAQWMYRTGGGFPVISFPPGTTPEQLETWADSGAFANIMARTYILIAKDTMDFKFEGAAGRALDPTAFFHTNDEQIAKGSGVPQPKLVGAQAGAVVGSELNQQEYYKVISRVQASLESVVRWVIDRLVESRQIVVSGQRQIDMDSLKDRVKRWLKTDELPKPESFKYEIEWVSAFELSEIDERQADLLKEQANEVRLKYMTKDEVRALNELEPLTEAQKEEMQAAQPMLGEQKPFGGEEGDQKFTVIQHASPQGNQDN